MNEDQNEQRAEKFRLLYRFLKVCQKVNCKDGELLAPATGVTAWPCGDLAPQLVPFKTLSERNFEQCSPSPQATAPTGPYDPRKSP